MFRDSSLLNKVEFVKVVKSQGAYFSKHLTWDFHIHFVLPKTHKQNFLMKKQGYTTLPTSIRKGIYNALFTLRWTYCHIIWEITTKQDLQMVVIVQKGRLRIICNVPWCSRTESYFINCTILKIAAYYNSRLACLYRVSPLHTTFTY